MGALEEYREHRLFRLGGTGDIPPDDEVNGDIADAAIAELEAALDEATAELAALIPVMGACPECGIDPNRFAAAEDELDKARCEIVWLRSAMTPSQLKRYDAQISEARHEFHLP